MTAAVNPGKTANAFVWGRVHSLTGLWFLIFLFEHLFTNSQAMMFFATHATWFVRSANFLRNIPYIKVIELVLLGVPFTLHMVLGIKNMLTSRCNVTPTDGAKPSLRYSRNHAYTWQRITALILVVGLLVHVIDMRFLDYPYQFKVGDTHKYYTKIRFDPGLYTAATELNVQLYDRQSIEYEKQRVRTMHNREMLLREHLEDMEKKIYSFGEENEYQSEMDTIHRSLNEYQTQRQHVDGLESRKLDDEHVIAVSPSFGALELLTVRERFQHIFWCAFYTIFVLAAVFHGGNGLWTFLITWGLLLSRKAQSNMVYFCMGLTFLLGLFGMMSIWGSYVLG